MFIDEVQLCDGFETVINSLYEEERFNIFLTGSNAFLLSSDLATLFGGRVFEISLYPFSFSEYLLYYLGEHSISRIFLNFSCPYPKYTYRNRRLTYFRYLDIYKKLLIKGGEIRLKTDNRGFFEFSLQSLSENGFILKNITLDLHAGDLTDNIETEYEKMFVAEGKPIYKLEAYLR